MPLSTETSRLQASSGSEEIPLHGAVGIDLERQPDLRCADRRLNGGRIERSQHADDLVRLAVEQYRAPDHAWVTAKSPSPETVAEHHGEPTAGSIFFLREGAAGDRDGAKEAEEISADVGRRDLFGIRIAGDVDDAETIGRDILKGTCLAPPDIELRRRRCPTGALGRDVEKHHQPLGIRIRQWLQDDGVEDRKNRRVRADPEGQRGHGSKRESRRAAQEPEGMAQVLNECVHRFLLLSPAVPSFRHQPGTVGVWRRNMATRRRRVGGEPRASFVASARLANLTRETSLRQRRARPSTQVSVGAFLRNRSSNYPNHRTIAGPAALLAIAMLSTRLPMIAAVPQALTGCTRFIRTRS